jgi:gas vesicle protein
MVERSDEIRHEIRRTRSEMGETVEALGYKANVPARTRDWMGDRKSAVAARVSGVTPDGQAVKERSLRMKDTAERNPLGLAVAGAAVGFVAGILAPSTRVENEKLGPAADQVKEQAADAGREALDHGKEVAQAAAQSAVDTAKDEGRRHGEEMSESLQEKARQASPSSAP